MPTESQIISMAAWSKQVAEDLVINWPSRFIIALIFGRSDSSHEGARYGIPQELVSENQFKNTLLVAQYPQTNVGSRTCY